MESVHFDHPKSNVLGRDDFTQLCLNHSMLSRHRCESDQHLEPLTIEMFDLSGECMCEKRMWGTLSLIVQKGHVELVLLVRKKLLLSNLTSDIEIIIDSFALARNNSRGSRFPLTQLTPMVTSKTGSCHNQNADIDPVRLQTFPSP